MRCKIDDGMLEPLPTKGYSERWKCKRCKVEWILEPRAGPETTIEAINEIHKEV